MATISGVMKNYIVVNPETKPNGLKPPEEQVYIYNPLSEGMTKNWTAMILLILPAITTPYFPIFTKDRHYSKLLDSRYHSFDTNLTLITLFHEKLVELIKSFQFLCLVSWKLISNEKVLDGAWHFIKASKRV